MNPISKSSLQHPQPSISPNIFNSDQLHPEQLKSYIKQIQFNAKNMDKNIQRLKKQIQQRITQGQYAESLTVINTLIQIDPNLSKLFKSKQIDKQKLEQNLVAKASDQLGRKINQISQSVTILYTSVRNLEKKFTEFQFQTKSSLKQTNVQFQTQINDTNSKLETNMFDTTQKIDLMINDFNSKLKQIEAKTIWQINDSKFKIGLCVEREEAKRMIEENERIMTGKLKEMSLSYGGVDPERINKIEQRFEESTRELNKKLTENEYRIQLVKNFAQNQVLSISENKQQKTEIQKRMSHFNTNISQAMQRLRKNQEQLVKNQSFKETLLAKQEQGTQKINKMSELLKNLNISISFQEMLSKINPEQIGRFQEQVSQVESDQQKMRGYLWKIEKQIESLRSRTQFQNILTPNAGIQKLEKEDVEKIVDEYFVGNMMMKKIQALESECSELRRYPEMVTDLNKKVARLSKETNTHVIAHELNRLQEYMKEQLTLMGNRIAHIEGPGLNSSPKSYETVNSLKLNIGNKRVEHSYSQKKLAPIQVLTSYESMLITPQKKLLSKKR